MIFPLDEDLSSCDGYIDYEVFFMAKEVSPQFEKVGKVSLISNFNSKLVVDKPIGDSTTNFDHFVA